MSRIKSWIRDWLNEGKEDLFADLPVQSLETHSISKNGMNIKFFRAQGGYVLETRHYDTREDENHYQLYIVTDDQDLGQEMSKILTVECMRNL